jgi:hypothetical protein
VVKGSMNKSNSVPGKGDTFVPSCGGSGNLAGAEKVSATAYLRRGSTWGKTAHLRTNVESYVASSVRLLDDPVFHEVWKLRARPSGCGSSLLNGPPTLGWVTPDSGQLLPFCRRLKTQAPFTLYFQ